MAVDKSLAGKQKLTLTLEFTDYDDPDKSQTNHHVWIDSPGVIGAVQAHAIMPAWELMAARFRDLATKKAINSDQAFEDMLKLK